MIIQSIFDPIVITTSIVSFIIFGSWFTYWYKNNLLRTERERAYACALLSSSVTSISSLPLVFKLLANGGDLSEILAYRTWTVIVTTFFMTFLFTDLSIGVVFYRNKIEMLTGWIHHITYLGVLTWAIHNQYTSIFVMMCILEVPTFILALGSVRTSLRRDYIFATTFLFTRILFHAYAIRCAWIMNPYGPVVNAIAVFFPVHCFWFYGFIKQQIRLAKKRKAEENNNSNIIKEVNETIISQRVSSSVTFGEKDSLKNLMIKSNDSVSSTTAIKNTITKSSQRKQMSSNYIKPNSSPSFHPQSPPVSVH